MKRLTTSTIPHTKSSPAFHPKARNGLIQIIWMDKFTDQMGAKASHIKIVEIATSLDPDDAAQDDPPHLYIVCAQVHTGYPETTNATEKNKRY